MDTEEGTVEDETEELEEDEEEDWKLLAVAVVVVVAAMDDVELSKGRFTGMEEGGEGDCKPGAATVMEFRAGRGGGDLELAAIVTELE